jgi:ATP-binding cassette subfamily B protein/subfamily B ATP-binding cassette protein MsbA
LALFAAALSLVPPRATMHIIDVVLPGGDTRTLHLLGGGLLVLIIIQQTCDLLRNWRTAKLNARIVFRLRQKLYEHLLRLPLHELADMKTGGITSRLSGDIDSVSGLVQIAIITPGVAGVKVMLTLAILLWISWKLAAAALILLPIIIALNLTYIRRIRPIYRSMRRDRGEIDGRVVETFGGIRVVRAFGRERTESLRYALKHHTVIRKSLLAQFLQYVVWSGWGFLIPLAGLIIIWFGGTLYLAGEATIGNIVAFQMYLMMLLMPVSAIVRSYGELQQALAAMERVFDLLRRPMDKPDPPEAVVAPQPVETFEFENVSFSYREDQTVLQSFALRVQGGMTVALVGPSGSGKTTVTNLVARFYDPNEGAVRLNGVDLRQIKLRSYRRLLGLVQQDVFLFDGSIAENIGYGRPDASLAEIKSASRRANAHEFIMAFPEGYDTLVGERGVRLSGGQAQRVSIARAILADPQILILDEATSNLDTESEQLIQASLEKLLTDRTTFVIAHRLSTITRADLIVVLADGSIAESGTHDQLMSSDGLYRAMVQRQQSGVIDAFGDAEGLT